MLTHALGVGHHLFRCRHGFVGLLHGLCRRDLVREAFLVAGVHLFARSIGFVLKFRLRGLAVAR